MGLNDKFEKSTLQNANFQGTIQELSNKLDEMSKKGKLQIDELIASNQELTETNEEKESQINELMECHQQIEDKHNEEIKEKELEIKATEIEYKIKEKKKK